jgi:predicted DNA repair protein MutK
MKKKIQSKLKHFFFENKFGKWLYGSMAVLNSIEGVIHLVVAFIGTAGVFKLWGLSTFSKMMFVEGVDKGMTSWAVMLPNLENLLFGVFSLAVGVALGIAHHHHH